MSSVDLSPWPALGPSPPAGADEVDVVDLFRVQVDLVEPLVAAHGVESCRDVVLVRVTFTDGTQGWGECDTLAAPTYTDEWTARAFTVLRDTLVPATLAGDERVWRASASRHPMASTAVEVALVDARLRRAGQSLAEALGAEVREVPAATVVGRTATVDDLVRRVADAVEAAAPLVKVKVAPDWFTVPLRALRSTYPELALAADANGSFAPDGARAAMATASELGLVYLEQPMAPTDDGHLGRLAAAGEVPLAVDESVRTAADAARLASAGVALVNLKPARVGGLGSAAAVVSALGVHGESRDRDSVGWFVGGLLELGVGRATALAVAARAASEAAGPPADLGPSSRYVDPDITDPIVAGGPGTVRLPDGAGLGVVPSADRLAEATVQRATVGRSGLVGPRPGP